MVSVQQKVVQRFGFEEGNLQVGNYMNIYKFDDPGTQKEVDQYIQHLFQTDPDVYSDASVISGAVLGSYVTKPVAYITRRPDAYGIGSATRDWLRTHGFYDAPVHFIPKGTCKSTKAKNIGVDVLIEDSPYEIMSCRENGLETLIMRYDYNDHVISDSEFVHNWSDITSWYMSKLEVCSGRV